MADTLIFPCRQAHRWYVDTALDVESEIGNFNSLIFEVQPLTPYARARLLTMAYAAASALRRITER